MWDKLHSEVNRALCLASQKDSSTPWLGGLLLASSLLLLGRPTDLIDEMQGGGKEV